MSIEQHAVENTVATVAGKVTYMGAGTTATGWLLSNEFAMLLGLLLAVGGFVRWRLSVRRCSKGDQDAVAAQGRPGRGWRHRWPRQRRCRWCPGGAGRSTVSPAQFDLLGAVATSDPAPRCCAGAGWRQWPGADCGRAESAIASGSLSCHQHRWCRSRYCSARLACTCADGVAIVNEPDARAGHPRARHPSGMACQQLVGLVDGELLVDVGHGAQAWVTWSSSRAWAPTGSTSGNQPSFCTVASCLLAAVGWRGKLMAAGWA